MPKLRAYVLEQEVAERHFEGYEDDGADAKPHPDRRHVADITNARIALSGFRDTGPTMPVIVIGADTDVGAAIVKALLPRQGEVRVFVTDPDVAATIRGRGAKVALGDVSDGSHIGAAALSAFDAVLIAEAATDGRERSFASDPAAVFAEWAEALSEAGVQRAIWVGDGGVAEPIAAAVAEAASVAVQGRNLDAIATEVAELDEAPTLD